MAQIIKCQGTYILTYTHTYTDPLQVCTVGLQSLYYLAELLGPMLYSHALAFLPLVIDRMADAKDQVWVAHMHT